MPADPRLTGRIRHHLAGAGPVEEKRMFGGTCFLLDGAIVATARHDGDLMVRIDPDRAEQLWAEPGARVAATGTRTMGRSWLQVDAGAVASDDRLGYWLDLALAHHRAGRAG